MRMFELLINGTIMTFLVVILLASCVLAYRMCEEHYIEIEEPDVVYEGPVDAEYTPITCASDPEIEAEAVDLDMLDYDPANLEPLAIVIYTEAGSDSCSDETRRMVGEVVLNRVADERFPDSVRSVLTQRGQYGAFYWEGVCWPGRAYCAEESHAVDRAYECARLVLTEPRLLPEDVVWQAEFVQGAEIVAHQDGLYFCRG